MKYSDTEHNHDCFVDAATAYKLLRIKTTDRAGFFIYVADREDHENADIHGRMNTAFAGSVFTALANGTLENHTPGLCDHCDRVARALIVARDAYREVMSGASTPHC